MQNHEPQSPSPEQPRVFAGAAPYIVPLAAMMVLTGLADLLPEWRPHCYILKVLVVSALLWHYRRRYVELRRAAALPVLVAVVLGLVLAALWVGLDPYYPQSIAELGQFAERGWGIFYHESKVNGQFDPFTPAPGLSPLLIIICRLLGGVVMVPFVEELFHRGWLLRYLVKDDFRTVPVGTFTWMSFLVSTILFGFSHHEWLAGLVCGAAFNGLLYWRRSLTLCVVAHAAANLGLAAWVLAQGAWQFW